METKEEQVKQFISMLKPHITAFSAQLPLNHKHEDEVKVGGSVLSVFDMNRLGVEFTAPYGEPVMPSEDLGVYMMVDDTLGQTALVVFQNVYLKLIEQLGGSPENLIGKVLVGEGQYAEMDMSTNFMTVGGQIINIDSHPHEDQTPRVFCHGMKLIES